MTRFFCVFLGSFRRPSPGFWVCMLGAAFLASASLEVGAQAASREGAAYPSRPVRLIVAVPSGSGADTITRIIGQKLSDRWGVGVVTDNRPGAGGVIAMDITKNSAPDGYTLLSASPGLVGTATLLRKVKYESTKAFEPVVQMTVQPYVLVINTRIPIKSVPELIAYAGKNPGVLNYASSGKGSASHMGTELFKMMAKVDITHIPYKGLAQAINEMAGGQTQVLFSTVVSVQSFIKSGVVRPIAAASSQRLKTYPDLPTVSESGVKGFDLNSAYALYAPLGTSSSVVEKINRDVWEILGDAESRKRIESAGAEISDRNSPEAFKRSFVADTERWVNLVKKSPALQKELFGDGL
jgi:tripartite-type tricarboxylate transporter receptor subunit TctC